MDLLLWRARQHTQDQHIWIPPIEWGPVLTHKTNTNVTRRGTRRLRQAPAEKDHLADTNHPEKWEATAPDRDTALDATGLCAPVDDLPPPPTDSDQAPPEVLCTVPERGHYYAVSTAASPGPQWVMRGTNTMLGP